LRHKSIGENVIEKHKLRKFKIEFIDATSGEAIFQAIEVSYCCFLHSTHFSAVFAYKYQRHHKE
jgi:hypothetical protein